MVKSRLFYLVTTGFFLLACPGLVNLSDLAAQEFDSDEIDKLFSLSIGELKNLDVISASKHLESLETVPASIYVITSETIEQYGYQDLQEALKSVPSVYLSNPHSWVWGGQRGFLSNFSQTLLMINGREVNNLIAFEGFISRQFGTHNIKQIEILASPGSALFGANALAGVINIITKEVNEDFDRFEMFVDAGSFHTKAVSLLFSQKITKDLRISGSGRAFSSEEEDLSEWTSNTSEFVPGWEDRDLLENYENFGIYKNPSRSASANCQIEYKGFYAGLNYYYNKQSHGQEKPSWDFTDNEDIRQFNLWYAGFQDQITDKIKLKLEYSSIRSKFWGRYYAGLWPVARLQSPGTIEPYQFTQWIPNSGVRAGHSLTMMDYDMSGSLVFDETAGDSLYLQDYYTSFAEYLIDQKIIDPAAITKDDVHRYFTHIYTNKQSQGSFRDKIDLQTDFTINDRNLFLCGYTFDYISYVGLVVTDAATGLGATYEIPVDLSKRAEVYTSWKHGVFVQHRSEILIGKMWLTLGGRLDYQNHYGVTFNPRSGLVYKPLPGSTFKIMYGEAFREGNVFELAGNPELKPAKLRGLEFSYAQDAGGILRNEIILYNNNVTDFLGSVGSLIGENVTSIKSQNVIGIENSTHLNIEALSGYMGLSYLIKATQEATNIISGSPQEVDLLSIPGLKLSVGISHELIRKVRFGLMNHFTNGYDAIGGSSGNIIRIDPANDLSATLLIHDINFNDKLKMNFFISVKNLLDQEYYHPNIRRSGTEKFIQNGRYLIARLNLKI